MESSDLESAFVVVLMYTSIESKLKSELTLKSEFQSTVFFFEEVGDVVVAETETETAALARAASSAAFVAAIFAAAACAAAESCCFKMDAIGRTTPGDD